MALSLQNVDTMFIEDMLFDLEQEIKCLRGIFTESQQPCGTLFYTWDA